MSTEALDTAVFDVLDALPGLRSVDWDEGQVDTSVEDANAIYPYAVVRALATLSAAYDTGDTAVELCAYRFQVFALDRATARARINDVREAFERRPPTLSDGEALECRVRADDCFLEPDRDAAGRYVYQGVLDLELDLERAV